MKPEPQGITASGFWTEADSPDAVAVVPPGIPVQRRAGGVHIPMPRDDEEARDLFFWGLKRLVDRLQARIAERAEGNSLT